jgi:benzoate membrane transport protein
MTDSLREAPQAERPPQPGRLERPGARPPSPREVLRDLGPDQLVNGLIGMIFSMTGPVAVILAVGARAGLPQSLVASWIFGVFVFNGLLTILAAWIYRQPLGFFWTIPGTVVVGQALMSLTWAEVIGAYVVSAVVMLVLGLSGKVDTVMNLLPMPVVMAMVAGVFLPFGLRLVGAVHDDVAVAAPMVVVFIVLTALPQLGRRLPPILGALVTGVVVVVATGRMSGHSLDGSWVASPVFTSPHFTWSAMGQLVLPLVITVLVVQNGQGMAVLTAAGHRPPMNAITIACGLVSLPAAAVGAVSTCLTGPTNALLTASGDRARQYTAAIWCGTLAVLFGCFAPGAGAPDAGRTGGLRGSARRTGDVEGAAGGLRHCLLRTSGDWCPGDFRGDCQQRPAAPHRCPLLGPRLRTPHRFARGSADIEDVAACTRTKNSGRSTSRTICTGSSDASTRAPSWPQVPSKTPRNSRPSCSSPPATGPTSRSSSPTTPTSGKDS